MESRTWKVIVEGTNSRRATTTPKTIPARTDTCGTNPTPKKNLTAKAFDLPPKSTTGNPSVDFKRILWRRHHQSRLFFVAATINTNRSSDILLAPNTTSLTTKVITAQPKQITNYKKHHEIFQQFYFRPGHLGFRRL